MRSAKGATCALFAALSLAALSLAACGPAPTGEPRAPEPMPASTVYIVLGNPPAAPADAWVPEEPHEDNPFDRTRTWIGDYDCPQGTTALTFRILEVTGKRIKAVFEFHHVDSGAAGKYLMHGRYDARTRTASFRPGAWLKRPPDYVTVSMKGDLALDGSLFAGRIEHPECGAFTLRPAE